MTKVKNLMKWFIIEEYRFFEELFGRRKFAVLPMYIFILAVALGFAIPTFGVELYSIAIVFLLVVFLFGFQTGIVGFDASDYIQNILSADSRVLFSSRTLPISDNKLISVFIIKDILFYLVIFIFPLIIGGVLGMVLQSAVNQFFFYLFSFVDFIVLFSSAIIFFSLGMAIGFYLTTIRINNLSSITILLVIISIMGVLFYNNVLTIEYFVSIHFSIILLSALFMTVLFSILGLSQFKRMNNTKQRKEYSNFYINITTKLNRITNKKLYILSKTLVDLRRSSGGFLKLKYSTLVVVFSTIILITLVNNLIGLYPSYAILFGSLYSLISFPIYSLVFRYDSIETYNSLPISQERIYNSKMILYVLLSVSIGLLYYGLTVILFTDSIVNTILGFIIFCSLVIYQLAIFITYIQDKPTEFLFDGNKFSIYSLLMFIILIPILFIGMYGELVPVSLTYVFSAIVIFVGFMSSIYIVKK